MFGVGKLSYYSTSIINGKREFSLKAWLVTVNCLTVFELLAENANDRIVSV